MDFGPPASILDIRTTSVRSSQPNLVQTSRAVAFDVRTSRWHFSMPAFDSAASFGVHSGQHVLELLDGRGYGRPQLGLRSPTGAVPADPLPKRPLGDAVLRCVGPGFGHPRRSTTRPTLTSSLASWSRARGGGDVLR